MSLCKKVGLYIAVSATDSNEFPLNKPGEFSVLLPQRIPLIGRWACGLATSYVEGLGIEYKHLLICCDIVQESPTYGESLPVLNELFLKTQRHHTVHKPIRYHVLNTQELYLIKIRVIGEVKELIRRSRFTLHFIPV